MIRKHRGPRRRSRATPWFRITIKDRRLMRGRGMRKWMQDVGHSIALMHGDEIKAETQRRLTNLVLYGRQEGPVTCPPPQAG